MLSRSPPFASRSGLYNSVSNPMSLKIEWRRGFQLSDISCPLLEDVFYERSQSLSTMFLKMIYIWVVSLSSCFKKLFSNSSAKFWYQEKYWERNLLFLFFFLCREPWNWFSVNKPPIQLVGSSTKIKRNGKIFWFRTCLCRSD